MAEIKFKYNNWLFVFSRAVALLFNWKYFWGWNLVWTMCGWRVNDTRARFGARFQLQMKYVIHTSSACHPHIICMLFTPHVDDIVRARCRWHPHVVRRCARCLQTVQQLYIKPHGFLVIILTGRYFSIGLLLWHTINYQD